MDLKTFFQHFDTLAEAPNGIAQLRSLILDLAIQGKLVPQNPEDEPAEALKNRILSKKKVLEQSKLIPKQKALPAVKDDEQPYFLPENWCWCRWDDVAFYIGDVDHKMPTEVAVGIPYVSPRDFGAGNTISFDSA